MNNVSDKLKENPNFDPTSWVNDALEEKIREKMLNLKKQKKINQK